MQEKALVGVLERVESLFKAKQLFEGLYAEVRWGNQHRHERALLSHILAMIETLACYVEDQEKKGLY